MGAQPQNEGMVTRKLLREITERIVEAVNPEKIIWGNPNSPIARLPDHLMEGGGANRRQ